jgi:ferredoxin
MWNLLWHLLQRKKKKRARAHIDPEICAGCKTCFLNCPQEAISVIKKGFIFNTTYCRVDTKICIGCGTCTLNCITGAVELY